jgi:perosamine synthetase
MRRIEMAKPILARDEFRAVKKVMKSGNLTQGPVVSQFETEFSKLVGGRECVAVNSGTSALLVALMSLGIGKDDEVIVPSFTFAATANSVMLTGARPVFVDIDPKTFNLDVKKIEAAISKKTRMILVVHLYGLPADMAQIADIAQKYGLLVVEDAAQAHLAQIDEHSVGTFGDAAAFSFYPTKNMTSGEGGMVVTKNSAVARTSRLLRNQGMEQRYKNEIVGFNFRMTDIHAAIGLVQLGQIEKWTDKRISNADFLSKNLIAVVTPHTPSSYRHVFHQYTIRVSTNRDDFCQRLELMGVGTGVYYPTPVHKLASFNVDAHLPETERACREVISLPVHPALSRRDLNRIVSSVNKLSERLY